MNLDELDRKESTSSTRLPFTIVDDDVKLDMDDSDLQRHRVLLEQNVPDDVAEKSEIMNITEENAEETIKSTVKLANENMKSEKQLPRPSRPLSLRQPCRIFGKVC